MTSGTATAFISSDLWPALEDWLQGTGGGLEYAGYQCVEADYLDPDTVELKVQS